MINIMKILVIFNLFIAECIQAAENSPLQKQYEARREGKVSCLALVLFQFSSQFYIDRMASFPAALCRGFSFCNTEQEHFFGAAILRESVWSGT